MAPNKKKYIELCKEESSIPLFSEPWWLDAACGEENWDVALVEKDNRIIGTLPFFQQRKVCFKLLGQPLLTQKMGPWIRCDRERKPEKLISYQIKVMNELIKKLPSFDFFIQNFNYDVTNWLPFYWKGFSQRTSYTYVIEDISDPEKVLKSFSQSKRNDVKKASKIVTVDFDLSADKFYEFHKQSLEKQNKKISYGFDLFKRLYEAGYNQNSAKTIYAQDSNNNIHSALFVVWNKHSAYYLVNALDPEHRGSSSISLLVLEMIRFLSDKTEKFDFEGSMIEGVESSYRKFGTTQKQLFTISKFNSPILSLYSYMRGLRK